MLNKVLKVISTMSSLCHYSCGVDSTILIYLEWVFVIIHFLMNNRLLLLLLFRLTLPTLVGMGLYFNNLGCFILMQTVLEFT